MTLNHLRSFVVLLAAAPLWVGDHGAAPAVRPGIDVLLTDSLQLVTGRRVGLLANQTAVDRSGVGDLERLLAAQVNVTAIFSPEHGYRGTLNTENIGNTVDSATGIPIYSLYGATRAPTPAMLANVDVLLIDLQDIGARTFTYVSSAVLAMRAVHAAGGGRRVVILDRPNPIDGIHVQGPTAVSAESSFVGMLAVPLRHGMTLGELARLANRALRIGAPLTIIPAAGWHRAMWFDETGLPWIRPSPNMPSLESAALYPGTVLFEATRLSVGRGTPLAYQVLGAPWLDTQRVRTLVGTVPGVEITDTAVTPREPSDRKYGGRAIAALRFRVVDRAACDPVRLALRVLAAVYATQPDSLGIDAKAFDRLAGTSATRTRLTRGEAADAIWRGWSASLDGFRRERAPFLLYSP